MNQDWPGAKVELRPIAELIENPNNPRVHDERQVEKLCAAIREWGWTTPVIVDEAGNVLGGHGRLMAARRLGLDLVPVMTAKGWSEAQKRAYSVWENRSALDSSWDLDKLKVELDALPELDFPIEMTGFSTDEWRALLDDPLGEDPFLDTPQPDMPSAWPTIHLQVPHDLKSRFDHLMQKAGSRKGFEWQALERLLDMIGDDSHQAR